MLIRLPKIMEWCGVFSILLGFIVIFILVWQIFHNKKKNYPPGERTEGNQSILKKTTDYEYSKVPLKEASCDKETAETESSSLKL